MKHTHTWLFFKRSSSYLIKYRGTTRSPKHPSPAHQPHIALLMQCMYAPSSSLLLSHEFTSAMQCFSLAATVTPGDASNASTFVGCPWKRRGEMAWKDGAVTGGGRRVSQNEPQYTSQYSQHTTRVSSPLLLASSPLFSSHLISSLLHSSLLFASSLFSAVLLSSRRTCADLVPCPRAVERPVISELLLQVYTSPSSVSTIEKVLPPAACTARLPLRMLMWWG